MQLNTFIEKSLEEYWKDLAKVYGSKTFKSKQAFERARNVLPGGVTYHIRFLKPYPIFVEKAKGSRVWDLDGNEYDDYWMGHGAHILGHAPEFVVKAVSEISKNGTHFGYENLYALEYAEFLQKVVPNLQMLRFTNSGTEANMYASRLARAYTKRKYIIKMEGGWHGGYDALHVGVLPPFKGPESLGLPEDFIKYTIVVPYNDIESLEKALKNRDVAAIFIEPVIGAGGCIAPKKEYLKEVRKLANEYDTLLVFDEVITGFRLALGGGQEFFNVDADLVVLGKIVGGGYPGAGVFGGKAEIMELLDHMKYPKARERSFHGGTFAGNPITIIAGYTLIKYLHQNRHLYEEANNLWGWVSRELDKLCEEYSRMCWITGAGTMIGIHFTYEKPEKVSDAYAKRWSEKILEVMSIYMRNRGILYLTEHMAHLLPSLIHTKEQAMKFIEVFKDFLEEVRKRIPIGKILKR